MPTQGPAQDPTTELDTRYSSALNPRPGAGDVTATTWAEAQRHLEAAEIFWVSTVRPDGRLHVTPVIAAWHDGVLYFSTGPGEQKARNLAHDAHCALTTGGNSLTEGLDLVVEGTAEPVADPAVLEEVIAAYEAKYGPHITSPEGTFHGLGDAFRKGDAVVFAVAPATAYGFGRDGGVYTHTRWAFRAVMSGADDDAGTSGSEPELVNLDPATTAVIRDVVPMAGLRDFFDASFRTLTGAMEAQRIAVLSPAFAVYHGLPGVTLDLEVGFVTDRPVRPVGDVVVGSLPGGRVARLVHVGSFDGLGASWERLHSWLLSQGLSPRGARWETYVTRPSPDMDPRDLRTELYWPVAE